MKFKRGKPKSARAGCLMCKPWKAMGNSKQAKAIKDLKNLNIDGMELDMKPVLERFGDGRDGDLYIKN